MTDYTFSAYACQCVPRSTVDVIYSGEASQFACVAKSLHHGGMTDETKRWVLECRPGVFRDTLAPVTLAEWLPVSPIGRSF